MLVCAALAIACGAVSAVSSYVEVPMNGTRRADTVTGFGLPSFFGSAADCYAVFKLGPFAPGKRYEATLTFDAGTDIGYATAWVDGDPAGKDFASFVGIGTPWRLGVGVTDRASSLTRDSQDTWGYYYVTDFDFDRTSPFLLTRSDAAAPAAELPASGYLDVAPGQAKKTATTSGWTWMPTWLDGDPKSKDSHSFVGIGTGTGTREMKGKESKFLFTVDPKSTAAFLYLVVRSNKPWDISMGLADRLSGVNRDSQDKWGYYYVTARLAYYNAMKNSAPARIETVRPSSRPRKRQRLFQKRQRPVILLPAESPHA
ncbi:MAG: hypothetical protein NTU62_07690 [Spirochaetes bacterium]|nr:hypothetical protein [Spirochaetota bacterium]